jgi:hypothetical protein
MGHCSGSKEIAVPKSTRLMSRGGTLFAGYFKRQALYSIDPDSWFGILITAVRAR